MFGSRLPTGGFISPEDVKSKGTPESVVSDAFWGIDKTSENGYNKRQKKVLPIAASPL